MLVDELNEYGDLANDGVDTVAEELDIGVDRVEDAASVQWGAKAGLDWGGPDSEGPVLWAFAAPYGLALGAQVLRVGPGSRHRPGARIGARRPMALAPSAPGSGQRAACRPQLVTCPVIGVRWVHFCSRPHFFAANVEST